MGRGKKHREAIEPGMDPDGSTEVAVEEAERSESKRHYIQAPEVVDPGLPCPHCGERYGHTVSRTYNQGQRRMKCSACGKPFPARRID